MVYIFNNYFFNLFSANQSCLVDLEVLNNTNNLSIQLPNLNQVDSFENIASVNNDIIYKKNSDCEEIQSKFDTSDLHVSSSGIDSVLNWLF